MALPKRFQSQRPMRASSVALMRPSTMLLVLFCPLDELMALPKAFELKAFEKNITIHRIL